MPATGGTATERKTALSPATTARTRARRLGRVDAPTVILHWLVAVLAFASFATGFRITGDAAQVGWASAIAEFALQGDVIFWHIVSAWCLVSAVAGYVMFLFRARVYARVALDAGRTGGILSRTRQMRWRAINVLIYWLAFVLIGAAALTGCLCSTTPRPGTAGTFTPYD